jgi:hypothetical protein
LPHIITNIALIKIFLQDKALETTKRKGEGREKTHKPKAEEHDRMPQHQHCPSAKIGNQSVMKSNKETLHEFSPHIPPKMSKGN